MGSHDAMIERGPPDTTEGDKFGIMHPANSVTGTGGAANELRRHVPNTPKSAVAVFDWVRVRRDGADLMLNAVYEPDAPRPPTPNSCRVAAHDDTAQFISCSDVDEAYEHLRAREITVGPPTDTSYGMRQTRRTRTDSSSDSNAPWTLPRGRPARTRGTLDGPVAPMIISTPNPTFGRHLTPIDGNRRAGPGRQAPEQR